MEKIWFHIGTYAVSGLELTGTLLGLLAVWLAGRNSRWNWPLGFFGCLALARLFWLQQLYTDSLLNLYYAAICIPGFFYWNRSDHSQNHGQPGSLHRKTLAGWTVFAVLLALPLTWISVNLSHWMPQYFPLPAAYPAAESLIFSLSIIAQFLMSRRVREHWLFWIAADVLASAVYYLKDIRLAAAEFVIFTLLAVWGWYKWKNTEYSNSDTVK